MSDRSKRVYEALKAYGFSPAKAVEIISDAKRHDRYAQLFIRLAIDSRRIKRREARP